MPGFEVTNLFEEHAELIKQGRNPSEFSHKILLAKTGEKFITHYETTSQRKADWELIRKQLNIHD